MQIIIAALLIIALIVIVFSIAVYFSKKKPATVSLTESDRNILSGIPFYQHLDESRKKEFENRMLHFLAVTKITGVNTEAEEQDKIYIAASAVIPIFGFKDWEYGNLREVLLYPDSFSHEFEQTGEGRQILGMVGDGAYNGVMILSKNELRQAFINSTGKSNTAIHEFVHLVDKTDGSTDGIPETFVNKKYILPWLQLMRQEIQQIMADRSDINPYGATNEAEFFAVVSEYFFERPDLLQEKHPQLFELLTQIFQQTPTAAKSPVGG